MDENSRAGHEHEVLVGQPGVSMESVLGLAKDWVVDD
jgi:hypothetical protein